MVTSKKILSSFSVPETEVVENEGSFGIRICGPDIGRHSVFMSSFEIEPSALPLAGDTPIETRERMETFIRAFRGFQNITAKYPELSILLVSFFNSFPVSSLSSEYRSIIFLKIICFYGMEFIPTPPTFDKPIDAFNWICSIA